MTNFSHPSYSRVLNEILTDEYKRYLQPPRVSEEPREHLSVSRDTSWKRKPSGFEPSPFAYGTLLGGAAVLCTWLLLSVGRGQPTTAEVRPLAAPVESVESGNHRTQRLETEMELVKKIVVGLVDSVGELSSADHSVARAGSEVISPMVSDGASLPFPVQVISEKANLRRSPDLKAQTVAEVPKKTVLLALDQQDKWLKVTTPKGEEAWVHRTVVSETGE
jgi:hypothetical protein